MITCFHKKKWLSRFDECVKIRNPGSVVLQVKVITMWQQIKNHSETPKYMKTLSPLHFLLTHPFDVCELSLSFYLSCLKVYFQTARVSGRTLWIPISVSLLQFMIRVCTILLWNGLNTILIYICIVENWFLLESNLPLRHIHFHLQRAMASFGGSACEMISDACLSDWVVIGSGGFGQVYKARHCVWYCDVAIKVLHYDDG